MLPAEPPSFHEPLMISPKTFNVRHPAYDARVARNDPGKLTTSDSRRQHPLVAEIAALGNGKYVAAEKWQATWAAMRTEIESSPDGARLFAERLELQAYADDLGRKHGAQYNPGWVNIEDGLLLYWLVRRLRPRTVVQTGVCNGFSCAMLALALARNGDDGQLHAIDLPNVFDPADPAWTHRGRVYGVMIPEGRSSGWLVPESCRERVHLQLGDAALLLPPLLKELGAIDLFFHDSDHTYSHMAFEFGEAKKVMRPGGIVVADDIAWNSSLWDAADKWAASAYNYAGSVGIAFL